MVDIVKVEKLKLLEIVRTNREKHAKDYTEAVQGYFVSAIDSMEKALARVSEGNLDPINISEQPPVSHLAEYDRAIRKLVMTIDDIIELNDLAFRNYVDDEWSWRQSWNFQNTKYLEAAASPMGGNAIRASAAAAKHKLRDDIYK